MAKALVANHTAEAWVQS